MRTMTFAALAAPLVALLGPFGSACAQEMLFGRTVTGHGMFEIKRHPEVLRIQVDVLAKGKTLKEALAKLRERRQAAQKNLEQIGAVAGSIEFGEPQIAMERNDRQHERMVMMMAMRAQGKKPAQKPKEAPPISVFCTLKAEVRLSAAGAEELLLAAHGLEERVKAADLGGLKELKQASAQDEEMAEEANAEMMGMNDNEGPKRGEPIFLYVSKLSDEERTKARADAFKKAQREAAKLAEAAGIELGPLYRLDPDPSAGYPDSEDTEVVSGPSSYFVRQYLERARGYAAGNDKQPEEAIGIRPGKVVYRVAISAAFELKKPK
jgi:uncharacterized protein YggE